MADTKRPVRPPEIRPRHGKVTDFYQNNGYFDFRILDTDIQTNEDKTRQTIKITVHEGGRFRWGKVSIEGDTNEVPRLNWKNC